MFYLNPDELGLKILSCARDLTNSCRNDHRISPYKKGNRHEMRKM